MITNRIHTKNGADVRIHRLDMEIDGILSIILIVSLDDGTPVGHCKLQFKRASNIGMITNLFVMDGMRGIGLATALLHMAEAISQCEGMDKTSLTTIAANNDTLRPFYEGRGYIVCYQFEDLDLLYVKSLSIPADQCPIHTTRKLPPQS